jgi:hypothetical protein
MNPKHLALCTLLILAAACSGDKPKDDADAANPAKAAVSPEQYRKSQQAFADSVFNSTKPAAQVAQSLGKGYAVGPVALRDTIASLAVASNCFKTGRTTDPYLQGTVSVFAHMAVIGVDLVQVQESKWTSAAGDLVNACLNLAMKNWKLGATFGKPAAYIVQVQFKSDSSALADTLAKAKGKRP